MSVKHIICKIDEIIRNTDTPREQKIEKSTEPRLNLLAGGCSRVQCPKRF